MTSEITLFDIVGLIMLTALLAIMGWVYLNREKYTQETEESRRILRLFGSLAGGVAASSLLGGQFDATWTVQGVSIKATSGLAFAWVVWRGWSKYDTGITADVAAQMIEEGVEQRLGKEISDAVIATESSDKLSDQLHQKDLAEAMNQLAKDVKQGHPEACKTIIQLEHRKDPKLLLAYFQKKKSYGLGEFTKEDEEILANMLFICGQYAEAKHNFITLIEENPKNINACITLAMIYERQGDTVAAINTLQKGLCALPDPKDAEDYNRRGKIFSFMAHLTSKETLADCFWNDAYEAFNRANDIEGKAESLFEQKSRREEAKLLLQDLPEVPIKTRIMRSIVEDLFSDAKCEENQRERNSLLERGFAKLSSALSIDERLKDFQSIALDYDLIARYHLLKGDVHLARESSDRALDTALHSQCWKAFRAALLTRGELEAESGKTESMHAWLNRASELSKNLGDDESSDIISNYAKRLGFQTAGQNLGFFNDKDEFQENSVEFALKLAEKNLLDHLSLRMKGFDIRESLTSYLGGKTCVVGLGLDEAKSLFCELGFDNTEDTLVNLEALKQYLDRMRPLTEQYEPLEFTNALALRQKCMVELERCCSKMDDSPFRKQNKEERILISKALYFVLGLIHRLGFDPQDFSVMDCQKIERAQTYIKLGSLDQIEDGIFNDNPYLFAIQSWAQAIAILNEKNASDEETESAIRVLIILGVLKEGDSSDDIDVSIASVDKITLEAAQKLAKIFRQVANL